MDCHAKLRKAQQWRAVVNLKYCYLISLYCLLIGLCALQGTVRHLKYCSWKFVLLFAADATSVNRSLLLGDVAGKEWNQSYFSALSPRWLMCVARDGAAFEILQLKIFTVFPWWRNVPACTHGYGETLLGKKINHFFMGHYRYLGYIFFFFLEFHFK